MITRISEFFKPLCGEQRGICIVCGTKTDAGNDIDFSSNFTSWSLLQEGSCICEYCYTLCRSQDYRRKSWVASESGVRFLDRTEILPTLLNPPAPPFAIYLTKSGKKQGFLHLITRPSYSINRYFIAFEDKLILIDRTMLEKLITIVKQARELKFSKTELMTTPHTNKWEHRQLCEQIIKYNKNPMWEVIVFAI